MPGMLRKWCAAQHKDRAECAVSNMFRYGQDKENERHHAWESVEGMNKPIEVGFHIICGTGTENGMNGVEPGLKGDGDGRVLNLTGLNSLLIADLNYFVEHHEKILEVVKKQIEERDYFREHPEELEEAIKRQQKDDKNNVR